MPMKRSFYRSVRRWLVGPVLGVLFILITASSLGVAARSEPLKLAVSQGPVSLLMYVADSERFFEREGVAVQLRDCTSGRDCYGQLARGEVNLATAAELLMTLNSANAPEIAIIATISASSRSIKLVARRDAQIAAPQDLRGKRIGTPSGTSAEYFLDSWLVFHDIDPHQVTVAALGPDRLASALEKRELDAIAIWEPIAGQAAAALGTNAILLPDPRIYTQHFSLLSTRKLIVEDEASLLKVLRALARAERYVAANPEGSEQILRRRLGVPTAPTSPRGASEQSYRLSLDQSLIATMDAQARWAVQQGLMPTALKSSNLLRSIEPSLLRRVAPESVNLVR